MRLDIAAINALMIFPKPGIEQRFIASENNKQMNLVDYLDRCRTAMGSRCLRRWVKMPLQDVEEINKRLAVV
jgi:DNA mismatch repair ATPase MutS